MQTSSSYFRRPLDTILSSEGAVRVLRELYMQASPLAAPALTDRTRLSHVAVLKILRGLVRTGILRALGSGRSVLYEIETGHPFASVLRPMFILEHERVQATLAALRSVAGEIKPAPAAAWLYGSVARGDDTPESDMDIALIVRREEDVERVTDALREGLHALSEAEMITFSVVGLSLRDVARLGSSRDPFWKDIARDAIVLMGLRPAAALNEAKRPAKKRRTKGTTE